MKNWLKHNVIILIFSMFLISEAIAADRILPVSKPTVDQETKAKTAKKKEIYPQKKPTKEIKVTDDTLKESAENEVIYPQKKSYNISKKD